MVDIAALPRETLSRVFQCLEPYARSSSKSDLLHCIQVCRLWNDLAVPLLYRQIWVYIASPPAEEDINRKLFSNRRTSQIRHLHILITCGGHVYDMQQQCDEIIEYIDKTRSMVKAATNLRLVDLDLCAFTPPDSIPSLQPSLQAANNLLVSLTGTIAAKRTKLRLRLSRPDIMAEAQVESACRPVFNDILREARGQLTSLSIGCPLSWLLAWIRENPQLQEINFTRTSDVESYEVAEFWDIVQSCDLKKLMLDGFDFPPIQKIPIGLVELILTRLEDTSSATKAILTHLPNLKVLSLRWEKNGSDNGRVCVNGDKIVCQGLRKAWWTFSPVPAGTIITVVQACVFLESLSLPRNVTNQDLFGISHTANWLTEVWIMDCPSITLSGVLALKDLKRLNRLQLQSRLSAFLSDGHLKGFIEHCITLAQVTLIFDDRQDETHRRQELSTKVSGPVLYYSVLTSASTFQSSNLGDKMLFNIKTIRDSIV
jgi:hypothetical protein